MDGSGAMVIKIGSSLLIDETGAARTDWMGWLCGMLAARPGPVVLVSSGAIALGRSALDSHGRPSSLAEAQACAAVGQIRLAALWSKVWAEHGRISAQILLTVGDLEHRGRYLNARNTLETLAERGVIPIVNENDTVATGEIRFGDNDRLSARVAQLIGAEILVLLSDVDGLYDANPKTNPAATPIPVVQRIDSSVEALAEGPEATGFGTGGMISKIAAARVATAAGCPVLLTSGTGRAEPLSRFLETGRGTWFESAGKPLARRKQWLRGLQRPSGRIAIDAGAAEALGKGASLLARGITATTGRFEPGELVLLESPSGSLGQGLTAYSATDLSRIVGLHSDEFEARLGYPGRGPVVHRDDLILFER